MKLFRLELKAGIKDKSFKIESFQLESDELSFFEKFITGILSGARASFGYHLTGTLNVPIIENCDRCLEKFEDPRTKDFNLWLTSDKRIKDDRSEDVILISDNSDEIDLSEVFRDIIYLEKRMKNICKADCKGLCYKCGANLNKSSCDCEIDDQDNRWNALKDFTD